MLKYDMVFKRKWAIPSGSNFAFKIAAKTAAERDTKICHLPWLPSPTPYEIGFSHNASVANREMTDGTEDRQTTDRIQVST